MDSSRLCRFRLYRARFPYLYTPIVQRICPDQRCFRPSKWLREGQSVTAPSLTRDMTRKGQRFNRPIKRETVNAIRTFSISTTFPLFMEVLFVDWRAGKRLAAAVSWSFMWLVQPALRLISLTIFSGSIRNHPPPDDECRPDRSSSRVPRPAWRGSYAEALGPPPCATCGLS